MLERYNILSCKHYAELETRAAIEKLSVWDRAVHRFHHLICIVCRRYSRQVKLIEQATKQEIACEAGLNADTSQALSAESKTRIDAELKRVLDNEQRQKI